jgi:hypothetical protein
MLAVTDNNSEEIAMIKPNRLIARMWDNLMSESVSVERMLQELRWDY